MSVIDWAVLFCTLLFIVVYGSLRHRNSSDMDHYLLGGRALRWWTIGISVMATQASAITFISTPGQAYEDGMRFLQFYLGLPLGMIFISAFIVPIYYRLKIYTAYEYLENRFDLKTRWLTALLFLSQRGLAAGITIYAPSIILSTVLGLNLNITNVLIGALVVIYTVSGGTRAVNVTQKQQMLVMMGGMVIALIVLIRFVTKEMPMAHALEIAGQSGKLAILETGFDLNDRYNIWTGLIGGGFLALAYFGTDQSQVARYLGGKSVGQMRLGLLFNGLFKIPMQMLILFTGVMLFVFYTVVQPPLFFNKSAFDLLKKSEYANEIREKETEFDKTFQEKKQLLLQPVENWDLSELRSLQETEKNLRKEVKSIAVRKNPNAETNDRDHIFISFVLAWMPVGLVGLLFAVILSAAMSSMAGELNSLAAVTAVDFYKRGIKPGASESHYVGATKWFTAAWGMIAILFASILSLFENLIQAVNIIGSLFYGSVLGIFMVGFFLKKVRGTSVFIAGIIAQSIVLLCAILQYYEILKIAYLWYNLIGCCSVLLIAPALSQLPAQKSISER